MKLHKYKILFINHSASKTGAPIVLLHILKWLKSSKQINFDVLSLENGDLSEAFTKVRAHHFTFTKSRTFFCKVKSKLIKNNIPNVKYPIRELNKIIKNNYDIVYANTVLSIPVGVCIKQKSIKKPKLIVHFHELNLVINQYCPELSRYKDEFDLNIAASNKVKENLLQNWDFNDDAIKVFYECLKIDNVVEKTTKEFIVGASALEHWHKGPDYFKASAFFFSIVLNSYFSVGNRLFEFSRS
uniref:hypothetical protein n=1 Tax=Gelidibacter sp. TaxID=2018083 RepID=UPI00404A846C